MKYNVVSETANNKRKESHEVKNFEAERGEGTSGTLQFLDEGAKVGGNQESSWKVSEGSGEACGVNFKQYLKEPGLKLAFLF